MSQNATPNRRPSARSASRNLLVTLGIAAAIAFGFITVTARAEPPVPAPSSPSPSTGDFKSPSTTAPSATPQAAPVAQEPAAKYQIEKGLAMFDAIRDDSPFHWTTVGPRDEANRAIDELEERAYDEVIRHARQFTTAELESHARRDLTFKDLHNDGRKSFKLDLIYFEGRLKRLMRRDPTHILQASGITDVYEAWIFPRGQIEAICVFTTELPAGLKPQKSVSEEIDAWVGIAGYSFKLMQYESQQLESKTGKNKTRRAPVLMGRSLTVLPDPQMDGGRSWRESFMPMVIAIVAALGLSVVGLAWWFRRGDRVVRQGMEERKQQNPFE